MFAQRAFGYQVRASGGEPTVALLAQPRAVATGQKPHAAAGNHARTRQLRASAAHYGGRPRDFAGAI
jgi:hypothetical protein